jgi:hypothetical protein
VRPALDAREIVVRETLGDVLHALRSVLEEDPDQLEQELGLVVAAEVAQTLDDFLVDRAAAAVRVRGVGVHGGVRDLQGAAGARPAPGDHRRGSRTRTGPRTRPPAAPAGRIHRAPGAPN